MQLTVFVGIWATGAFILFQAVNYVLAKRRQSLKSQHLGCKSAPMYSPGDPFGIYNLYLMLRAISNNWLPEYMVERVHAVSAREGRLVTTFRDVVVGQKTIFTCEPKNLQAMLATQFKDFELGEGRCGNFGTMLGRGIFATDGKLWAHSRSMLRPQFAREQINNLDLEEKHVQQMLKVMPVGADGWTSFVNLQQLLFRLTLDTATEFLFGESVNSQLAQVPGYGAKGVGNEHAFSHAFDEAQWYIFRAGRFGRKYWLAHDAVFRRHIKHVHEFVDFYVKLALDKDLRKKNLEAAKLSGSSEKHKYIFLEAIAEETQDPLELRDQLLNILLAGRDTTASTLSWIFLMLFRHPDIFTKLRQSILDDFGSYTNPKEITFASLKDSTYLQHTLKEALRLFTVVAVNGRCAATDTSLPLGGGPDGQSPIFVPKGTDIVYSTHVMHKRKDLWGEDVDEFRPERWEGKRHGWEYLPFSGGPRICIGQQFALTEASYVLVRFLQKYDTLEGVDKDAKLTYRVTLVCTPGDGVRMRFREAKY
ncbi:Cytochrome p450 family protein [Neofusicoccum parvum]|uniref:Cytochrome p450 family protein n=1 Tax=Neofusicoccum parvum TaxID=310453 RepID=A0ACB5SCR1_9PEZI|nr:Cytochrome p450 family protein [Neofusicoccum parvum]